MADAVLCQQQGESAVAGVRPGVVGHEPFRCDSEPGEEGEAAGDEAGDGVSLLVSVQLAVGQSAVIVDE
jgi:hypothetical protein